LSLQLKQGNRERERGSIKKQNAIGKAWTEGILTGNLENLIRGSFPSIDTVTE
jgi:hypothetical protein